MSEIKNNKFTTAIIGAENLDYHCDICGNSEFSQIYDRGRGGITLHNYICENCGFVFVYPRPSEEIIQDTYVKSGFSAQARGNVIPDTKKYRDCERAALMRHSQLKRLLDEKHICVKGNAIDIGTGTGGFVEVLNCNGWKAEGLEPDVVYAEAAEKHYGIIIHKVLLQEYHTSVKYNLVTAFNVIEHVLHPKDFIEQCAKLLSDDGILYLDMPGLDEQYTNLDDFFWEPHINTFSRSSLYRILEQCGLQVLEIWYSDLKYLSVIAKKEDTSKIQWKREQLSIYRLKSIVDTANSPQNANSDTLFLTPCEERMRLELVHIGIHNNGNAGDTLLFPAVRALLQKYLAPIEFSLINLREKVTQETIEFINKHDGVVIGGGGLFLKDTNYNDISGWQWACSCELLQEIRVPILIFAVGYNRFRDQEDFDDIFSDNLNLLVEKSAFFSLRNHGSIDEIKRYLNPNLHRKLAYQPCPTTLLSRFYPNCTSSERLVDKWNEKRTSGLIALNIPFDRYQHRYKYLEPEIFKRIADAICHLQYGGWNVVLYNHLKSHDSEAARWLSKYGLEPPQLDLDGMPPNKVIEWYNKTDVAIGGRGHAQMIPFGLNIPIFSLISHDKLGFFLDDISHPEWGEEVLSNLLADKIIDFVNSTAQTNIRRQLLDAQDYLWQVTMNNIEHIRNIFWIAKPH
jgi:polysaccharide pyruvyl transferase WcaK-like protein/SAM-dependent methyltransferase